MGKYGVEIELDGKPIKVRPTNKRDKITWSYKRSAIKGFMRKVICRFGWLDDYVSLGKPFSADLRLIDTITKEVICKANIHNDEKYMYVPRYNITPIDPVAKEYYKTN